MVDPDSLNADLENMGSDFFMPSEILKSVFGIEESKLEESKCSHSQQSDSLNAERRLRRFIRHSVSSNVESLKQSDNQRVTETCVICMEDIKDETAARIDGCNHKFCFQCIDTWGTNNENACPLCKTKFNKIYYKTVTGEEASKVIVDRRNDDYEFHVCDHC